MNRILITGVNGLLGRSLAASLLKNKENIIFGISRQKSFFQHENYHHLKLDLQSNNFEEKFPEFIDIIIHLAQSNDYRDFPLKANNIFDVNIHSTQKLLNFGLKFGCKKFIYASSGGVYGFGNQCFSEESDLELKNELGYYLTSKIIGELLVKNYSSCFTTIILRPFFIYGKGQKKQMLLPRLINSIKNNIPITIQGNYGIKMNPIHVLDAVNVILKCLNVQESSIYNVAGNEVLDLKNICEIIGEKLNISPIFINKDLPVHHLIGDINKMRLNLKEPKITFTEGINDLI